MAGRLQAGEEGSVKKKTVHQLLILAAGGVLALTLYDFLVRPAVAKVVAGPLRQPQLR